MYYITTVQKWWCGPFENFDSTVHVLCCRGSKSLGRDHFKFKLLLSPAILRQPRSVYGGKSATGIHDFVVQRHTCTGVGLSLLAISSKHGILSFDLLIVANPLNHLASQLSSTLRKAYVGPRLHLVSNSRWQHRFRGTLTQSRTLAEKQRTTVIGSQYAP